MKKLFLFIFLIGFITCLQAQIEFNNKFKGIPPANKKPKIEKKDIPPVDPNVPVIIPPNIYKNPNAIQPATNPVDDYKVETKTEMSMIQKESEFINPGDDVRDRLSKSVGNSLVRNGLKEDDSYLRKVDLDFGVIYTKSPYLIIKFRDYGAIDGDFIKAALTHDYKEVVLVNRLFLDINFKDVKFFLNEGFSFLVLEALNRGQLGGNTGEFEIHDNTGKMLVHDAWGNLDTGVKAKFKIVKE
ncbi:hypothetical protein [Flavobacterium sp. HJJ]|uniref:hypothetical protein n=1 Tax=Flavobacterium sp. HJJ TaxID=2783792 RepID=UPI00188CF0D2|nr:hypothetical protein [Flavobacterium sp. HJJ]MBF4470083.1 hypothetical protein [Flavobacterium sp. HJJ]